MSREYTTEEVRNMFLEHVAAICKYWDKVEGRTSLEKIEGCAFSILSALDGCSAALPAFVVSPMPDPTDKQYHIDEGSNFFPEAPEVECDIGGGLHELFHKFT